ncbi:amidase family protein [Alkalilimnicola ehrlichii MLHE-1]|uniref:allophanate hydrolase-related protein n=1 Tax=Alkalilimnicola ehrlichii TaxID=351052 RepID=UPI0018DB97EA|nr:amidase family protein [Alkalilimnicola ehrlichii]
MGVNSRMGTYTNFVNLADFCALSVPAGFRADGLPFGGTLISGAWKDGELQALATEWLNHQPTPLGATDRPRPVEQAVTPESEPTTAPRYRLHALPDTTPPKPGLRRVGDDSGRSIVLEVWRMPAHAFGSLVDLIPSPLGIGKVELADGRWVNGFVCEGYALEGARDVTDFGGRRAYIEQGR